MSLGSHTDGQKYVIIELQGKARSSMHAPGGNVYVQFFLFFFPLSVL